MSADVIMMAHPEVPHSPPTSAAQLPHKLSENESNQFELTSYVLMARTHHCTTCNGLQNFSELYEVWTHPTKTALSNAKILKSANRLNPGFPVATVINPLVAIPICHECVIDIDPNAGRAFPPVSYSAWADTIQRKAQELQQITREAAKAKTTPTLDQL